MASRPVDTEIKEDSLQGLHRRLMAGQFTTLDYLVLGIYPSTLVLGFCFSLGHSTSYFAHSHNVFNLLFVKNGWLWTSIIFWTHLYRLPDSSLAKRQAALRWVLASIMWILVTQWAFGAPLTDRTMIWTGGVCALAKKSVESDLDLGQATETLAAMTNRACRAANGHWEGGHDLSGHVFILTHSSLFIWYEILPLLLQCRLLDQKVTKAAFAMLGGWWWMLLMTAAYFHTWREKLTGLATGLLGWLLVYKLAPRFSSTRNTIGVPTVSPN